MVGETVVTVVGNLTDDPEIRNTPSGEAVTHFTVASTPRTFDRQSNEWRDADTLFLRCSVWRKMAEHVAQSLTRGARVIVQGRLHQRTYETREGEKRTVIELEALEIGPSLRYADATVSKISRVGVPGDTLFDTAPSASNDAPEAPDGDKSAPHDHNSPTFPF
ncbi:single-stranded DNA-binding protein [Streptomyces pratens]|uniref:Single-stranded DNA-binding protein n=1 Tax=Streptomyces pratens TaxID=887456 RepID=A0ABW1M144_9ACTN